MTAVPSPSAQHPALRQLLPSTVHAHPLRVTSQQTMSTSIAFALNHLRQPDSYPLVLHCLPSTSSSTPSSTSDPASLSNKTAETSVAALPKLVSLSEVIQREWFSVPLPSSSSSSQPSTSQLAPPSPSLRAPEDQSAIAQAARTKGLHQYTLLTTLEEIKLADPTRKSSKDAEEDEIARQEEELVVMGWLTGKAGREKRPRKKHTPTMLVVLATASIPELVGSRNWTYQASTPPSRDSGKRGASSAEGAARGEVAEPDGKKKRRRRRRARAKQLSAETNAGEGMDVDVAADASDQE